MNNLKRLKWTTPTPIQKYAVKILKDFGRDLMAAAQTGSGKTGAMLIPTIDYLLKQGVNTQYGTGQRIKVLMVAPTRELATQIYDDARRLSHGTDIKVNYAYGGTASRGQCEKIYRGTTILIGTPGRLVDFADKHVYVMNDCEFFFLDEADRMLDMGFRYLFS